MHRRSGWAALCIAVALGLESPPIAGSPERRAAATAAGAHEVYDPGGWFDAVRADGGADVIVDPVGGDIFEHRSGLAPE